MSVGTGIGICIVCAEYEMQLVGPLSFLFLKGRFICLKRTAEWIKRGVSIISLDS